MTISAELMSQGHELSTALESARNDVITSSALKPVVTLASLEAACSTEDLKRIFEEAVVYCIRYAVSVVWFMKAMNGPREEFAEVDASRKRVHDATVDAINVLVRALKRADQDVSWISEIAGNRSAYGKLALLLAFEQLEQRKD